MALHNIKIVVVDGGKSGSYKSKNAGLSNTSTKQSRENVKDTPLYNLLNSKENIENKARTEKSAGRVFAKNMALNIASQLVKQTANYYISDIGRKNGDSNYQDTINRQLEVVSDVASVGLGALAGATSLSMIPGGAIVGAILGATSSAISIGFRQAEREREYQYTLFQENTSQVRNLARANYSIYTGRLR